MTGLVETINEVMHSSEGTSLFVKSLAEIVWPEGIELLETCVGHTENILSREKELIK